MKSHLLIGAAMALLMTGCTDANDAEKEEVKEPIHQSQSSDNQNDSEDKNGNGKDHQQELTSEEIMIETAKRLNTEIPVKLPGNLTVKPDYHLSVLTSSEQNQYIIQFFETQQPIPINDEELKNKDVNVATLRATKYETSEKAGEQIGHQDHSVNGAAKVDLGFDIRGYRDAGAGSQFMGWNEGRWSLEMRALTEQGNTIEEEAKKVVQFLEQNTLPIPHEWGALKFDITDSSEALIQHIAWQENTIVYEIETTSSYMDALEIAVFIQE